MKTVLIVETVLCEPQVPAKVPLWSRWRSARAPPGGTAAPSGSTLASVGAPRGGASRARARARRGRSGRAHTPVVRGAGGREGGVSLLATAPARDASVLTSGARRLGRCRGRRARRRPRARRSARRRTGLRHAPASSRGSAAAGVLCCAGRGTARSGRSAQPPTPATLPPRPRPNPRRRCRAPERGAAHKRLHPVFRRGSGAS